MIAEQTITQRRILTIALFSNATMFVVGLGAGLLAQSSGLIADSLDMLADASAYAIALIALERGNLFKARAAGLSGTILLLLGLGVLFDVARRSVLGSVPEGVIIITVATVTLIVNSSVLFLLHGIRREGVHLNATWLFTKVDVIANLAVIVSGIAVLLTGYRSVDLLVGGCIGLYVTKEAVEILQSARKARRRAVAGDGDYIAK